MGAVVGAGVAANTVEERRVDIVDAMELQEAVVAEMEVVGIADWELLVPDQVVGSRALSAGLKEPGLGGIG